MYNITINGTTLLAGNTNTSNASGQIIYENFQNTTLDLSCAQNIVLDVIVSNVVDTLKLTFTLFDLLNNQVSYTQNIFTNMSSYLITIPLNQITYPNVDFTKIKKITMSLNDIPNDRGSIIECERLYIDFIPPTNQLSLQVIQPYMCNSGKITVKDGVGTIYYLTTPSGKIQSNTTGIFYVVKPGSYIITTDKCHTPVVVKINIGLSC